MSGLAVYVWSTRFLNQHTRDALVGAKVWKQFAEDLEKEWKKNYDKFEPLLAACCLPSMQQKERNDIHVKFAEFSGSKFFLHFFERAHFVQKLDIVIFCCLVICL